MDVLDHNKLTIPSGHGSHGVYLCRRCGWPFPNPHPSAKHRRSHKKICGTIDGYTNLLHSEVVSDDEHHPDEDKEKSPSPKIEKKTSIGAGGGAIGRSSSRSEEDSFSDAVTEFSDTTSTGSIKKTLDKDIFFSFKDAENEIRKVDSSEALVKLESTLEQSDEQEAEVIDVVGSGVNLETVTAEEITEDIKHENLESESKNVSEAVKVAELVHEHGSEVAKESKIDQKVEEVGEETKQEKVELNHEHVPEVVKEPETAQSVLVLTHEVVEEPDAVLVEKHDLGAPKLEKDSNEQFQEVVHEPVVVFTENTDLTAPKSENCSIEEIEEVVKELKSVFENPESVLTEKEDLGAQNVEETSKEDTKEAVQEPNSTLIEKEDLGAPKSENGSTEQIQEVVNEPVTFLTQKDDLDALVSEKCSNNHTHEVVEEPKIVLTEKEDLEAPIFEKSSKEHTSEVIEEPKSDLIEKEDLCAPIFEKHSIEHTNEVLEEPVTTLTKTEDLDAQNFEKLPKEETQEVTKEPKVVSEPVIGKLITNQDSGVDLSVDSGSHNSLEGNWGSVSVLSTASVDDKPKKLDNNHSGTSDAFEAPSFMTLVDPQVKDQKPGVSEVQDAQKAGWFPTITNVSNESEGRKKNEEVIAKVTNWTTGNTKHSAPLKSLLGEAKSPNVKEPEPVNVSVDHKDGGEKQELLSSPPKLIDEGKKGGKKVKGRSSWMPFVCCSSVNVVK